MVNVFIGRFGKDIIINSVDREHFRTTVNVSVSSRFLGWVMALGDKVEIAAPDNEVDKEAIRVEMPGLGKVGYVANSSYTVKGESWSAGRIYDKIGETAEGTVMYKLPRCVICSLTPENESCFSTENTSEAGD